MSPTHHPRQQRPPKPIRSLSDYQLEILLRDCPCPWHNAILTILADTGLRLSELCGLIIPDLWMLGEPLHALRLRPAIAKNHIPRTIPLTQRSVDAIKLLDSMYWSRSYPRPTMPAFYSKRHANPISTRRVQRIVAHYGLTILNIHLTPHMLRHTFATRLVPKCNIRVIQQLLGHSSLQSTQIYTHPTTTDLQTAIDALNA